MYEIENQIKEETFVYFKDNVKEPASFRSLYIDLVDACNLACGTCYRGLRLMKNKRGQMSLDTFEKVLDKAHETDHYGIWLYNWTEPFLCHRLSEYAQMVKDKGFFCGLSSNLSLPCLDLISTLQYCDQLIVSVSGFTQDTYKINHKGGNIKFVKRNLERIALARDEGRILTQVDIRYFNFPHSAEEFYLFKRFADDLGLDIVLWKGLGDPINRSPLYVKEFLKIIGAHKRSEVWQPPSFSACFNNINFTVLNKNADVFLCCCSPNTPATCIGNFLEDDWDILQFRAYAHPYCAHCSIKVPVKFNCNIDSPIVRGLIKQLKRPSIPYIPK